VVATEIIDRNTTLYLLAYGQYGEAVLTRRSVIDKNEP
jgi:hypothetical protein